MLCRIKLKTIPHLKVVFSVISSKNILASDMMLCQHAKGPVFTAPPTTIFPQNTFRKISHRDNLGPLLDHKFYIQHKVNQVTSD